MSRGRAPLPMARLLPHLIPLWDHPSSPRKNTATGSPWRSKEKGFELSRDMSSKNLNPEMERYGFMTGEVDPWLEKCGSMVRDEIHIWKGVDPWLERFESMAREVWIHD